MDVRYLFPSFWSVTHSFLSNHIFFVLLADNSKSSLELLICKIFGGGWLVGEGCKRKSFEQISAIKSLFVLVMAERGKSDPLQLNLFNSAFLEIYAFSFFFEWERVVTASSPPPIKASSLPALHCSSNLRFPLLASHRNFFSSIVFRMLVSPMEV